MGLFSSNKHPCPVCGAATPRIFPTKVQDMPICKECADKVELPTGALDRMTVEDFRQYIAYHDTNGELRSRFNVEYAFDLDGYHEIQIDFTNNWFRTNGIGQAFVFEGACLRSFRILEDSRIVYEGNAQGLHCYETEVYDRLERLQPVLMQYLADKRQYEHMRAMQEMIQDDDKDRPRRYIPEPRFDPILPVKDFRFQLVMDHPYWKVFEGELNGPTFGVFDPNLETYAHEYEDKAREIEQLAHHLMTLIAPDAPVVRAGGSNVATAPAAAAPSAADAADPVAEIKKYKELLDAGIITEEDFAIKKRLLLGL